MRRRQPTALPGYTLVELLVVVGVLAIAGTLLLPNLVDRGTFAIQAAARSVVADIVFAQSDALANQEFRRFQFLESSTGETVYSGYCITRVDTATMNQPHLGTAADFVEHPEGTARSGGDFIVDFESDSRFQGVSITSVDLDSGRDFMTFDEYGGSIASAGGAPGTGGTIELASSGHRYRVTVAPFTGKTTVEVLASP